MSLSPRPLPPLPAADLDHVLTVAESDWRQLRGARLFITGGTGFFGTWLLESLDAANARFGLGLETWVLSRDPAAFARRSPHLAQAPGRHWVRGEVSDFTLAESAGSFTHLIHAATAASAALNTNAPAVMLDTIVQGTRRVLDFAATCGRPRVLLTSSGAVYGRQPMRHVPESYGGGPDCLNPASAYAEGKRLAELLCSLAARQHGLDIAIARCFAFVGPHLPLDAHFAAGNFLNDVLAGRDIIIQGDGTPYRSYLHAADLVVWLIGLLGRAPSLRPYNLGSDEAVSIAQVAQVAAACRPGSAYRILTPADPTRPPESYVPDIRRARDELGLAVHIPLAEAFARTYDWCRAAGFGTA